MIAILIWEEERFREFEKELPESWQIEEPGLGADTTPGRRRCIGASGDVEMVNVSSSVY